MPLVLEYEAVLTRPDQLEASRLTADDVAVVLDALVAVADPVRLSFRWRPVLPDPDDDMVIETAANGWADLLVTFNQRDFEKGAKQFDVVLATPGEALERLRLP